MKSPNVPPQSATRELKGKASCSLSMSRVGDTNMIFFYTFLFYFNPFPSYYIIQYSLYNYLHTNKSYYKIQFKHRGLNNEHIRRDITKQVIHLVIIITVGRVIRGYFRHRIFDLYRWWPPPPSEVLFPGRAETGMAHLISTFFHLLKVTL